MIHTPIPHLVRQETLPFFRCSIAQYGDTTLNWKNRLTQRPYYRKIIYNRRTRPILLNNKGEGWGSSQIDLSTSQLNLPNFGPVADGTVIFPALPSRNNQELQEFKQNTLLKVLGSTGKRNLAAWYAFYVMYTVESVNILVWAAFNSYATRKRRPTFLLNAMSLPNC